MQKPTLSFGQMWNLSFGFFGVQIAYALQSANISRIFATLGADPHTLSFFWVLPPLMGMIVQPIVGSMSDKTWCKWGRRKPYLYVGAIVAVIVMALLPNSGSFDMTVKAALAFGAIMLMLLDTSINMAMQPFKMMVGDMVNEGDVICYIEAMKTYNAVRSEFTGKVLEICMNPGDNVFEDDVLIKIG